jgi:predicted nucleic acid-binding protein
MAPRGAGRDHRGLSVRHVSLVDAVSFIVKRTKQIAFAFDPHYVRAGFRLLG